MKLPDELDELHSILVNYASKYDLPDWIFLSRLSTCLTFFLEDSGLPEEALDKYLEEMKNSFIRLRRAGST